MSVVRPDSSRPRIPAHYQCQIQEWNIINNQVDCAGPRRAEIFAPIFQHCSWIIGTLINFTWKRWGPQKYLLLGDWIYGKTMPMWPTSILCSLDPRCSLYTSVAPDLTAYVFPCGQMEVGLIFLDLLIVLGYNRYSFFNFSVTCNPVLAINYSFVNMIALGPLRHFSDGILSNHYH
jgi:hypothetical protein